MTHPTTSFVSPASLLRRTTPRGPRTSAPFRERNPVVVGAISLAVVVGLILVAFNADKLPVIGGGTTYYAAAGVEGPL